MNRFPFTPDIWVAVISFSAAKISYVTSFLVEGGNKTTVNFVKVCSSNTDLYILNVEKHGVVLHRVSKCGEGKNL